MRYLLSFLAIWFCQFAYPQQWELSNKVLPSADAIIGDEFGRDMAVQGNILVVGAPKNDRLGEDVGIVYVYESDGTHWIKVAELLPSNAHFNQEFGHSVDIKGDYVAIGSPKANAGGIQNAGAAYIFKKLESWSSLVEIAILAAPHPRPGDLFGFDVSVSANDVLVSATKAHGQIDGSGAVFTYVNEEDHWVYAAKLTGGMADYGGFSPAQFGKQIERFAEQVYISSPHSDYPNNDAGLIYIFNEISEVRQNFVSTSFIGLPNAPYRTNFGLFFDISSLGILVGGRSDVYFIPHVEGQFGGNNLIEKIEIPRSGGSVLINGVGQTNQSILVTKTEGGIEEVFEIYHTGEVSTLSTNKSMIGRLFGAKVLALESQFIVAAPRDNSIGSSGSIYFYLNASSGLGLSQLQGMLSDFDRIASFEQFGSEVAISGSVAAISAHLDDVDYRMQGSVYIYEKEDNEWMEKNRIFSPSPGEVEQFGRAIAIDGDRVVVSGGGVFVFDRPAEGWEFPVHPKIVLNVDGFTYTGSALAAHKDRILVATNRINSYPFKGTVKSYILVEDDWVLEAELVPSENVNWFGMDISLLGNRALVASENQVFLFEMINGNWVQLSRLMRTSGQLFSSGAKPISVKLTDSLAIVGTPLVRNALNTIVDGEVLFYDLRTISATMTESFKIVGEGTINGSFGRVIDANDQVLIGNPKNFGTGHLFIGPTSNYTETQLSSGVDSDYFGASAMLGLGDIVVGSPSSNDAGELSGAAYFYTNSTGIFVRRVFGESVAVGIGESISLFVEYSDNIHVSGYPSIILDFNTHTREAMFKRTVGNLIELEYVVQEGDFSYLLNYDDEYSFRTGGLIDSELIVSRMLPSTNSSQSLAGTSIVKVDGVRPTSHLSSEFGNSANSHFTLHLLFNEVVTGLEVDDFYVSNGSVIDVSGSGIDYSILIEPIEEGNVSVYLKAETVYDLVGNVNLVPSNQIDIDYDITRPTILISTDAPPKVDTSFTIEIEISEHIKEFSASSIHLEGAVIASFFGTNMFYQAVVRPTVEGDVVVRINDASIFDLASNANIVSNTLIVEYDTLPPILSNTGWLDESLGYWPGRSGIYLADINNDGDLDMYFDNRIYEFNGDGYLKKDITFRTGGFTTIYWIDINQDGFMDLFRGGFGAGAFLYINDGTGNFQEFNFLQGADYYDFGPGFFWVDLNNDGRLEFITTVSDFGSNMEIRVFKLDNANVYIDSGLRFEGLFGGHDSPFVDFDGDGLMDFVLVKEYNCMYKPITYRNLGDFRFESRLSNVEVVSSDFNYFGQLKWGDFNYDYFSGGLDLMTLGVSGCSSDHGKINIYNGYNGGLGNTNYFLDSPFVSGVVEWGDFDLDGDFDIFHTIKLENGRQLSGIFEFQRFTVVGDPSNFYHEFVSNEYLTNLPYAHDYSSLAIGDIDGDGDIDAIVTGSLNHNDHRIVAYQNMLIEDFARTNAPPNVPSNLRTIFFDNKVSFLWDESGDDLNGSKGNTYNLIILKNGKLFNAPNSRLDGKRLVSGMGNAYKARGMVFELPRDGSTYEWSVQAVDNTFTGSSFAPFVRFTMEGGLITSVPEVVDVRLWPNPAKDLLNIDIGNIGSTMVVLYSLDGRLIQSKSVSDSFGTMSLAGLPKGMYLLKVITKDGLILRKIVKD